MPKREQKPIRKPGEIRDAIAQFLRHAPYGASVAEIVRGVTAGIGPTSQSSIRSYLRLNTPRVFERTERGHYLLRERSLVNYDFNLRDRSAGLEPFSFGQTTLFNADCLDWLRLKERSSIHAVVTDPPYGLFEYTDEQQAKLRAKKGGVWRIPPSFDGVKRAPVPRFTVLSESDLKALDEFFFLWARLLYPVLVPGANLLIASNPLLSGIVGTAVARAGFERRGELVRLVMTMRGGDRPKAAHDTFKDVSVMPRSMWEPWLVFRKQLAGRAQDNLRQWKTGGFRRPSSEQPFGDVIRSSPTRATERALAPHPSLKPQGFMRQLVRASLPLGEGIILDPFAGSGSTLAAAEAIGYHSIGVERDLHYFEMATRAIPKLASLKIDQGR